MNAADDLLMLGRVVASLVVVIALAAIVAKLARRASVRGNGVGVEVVDRVGLSREAALAVVNVGGRALVLGVTAHGVSLLTELDADLLTPPAAAAENGEPAASQPVRGTTTSSSGSVLDPRTWKQAVNALRDLTVRR